jgi:hypothetical protein
LREMPVAAIDDPLRLVQARLGDTKGVTFLLGGRPLFSVVESDVDIEARQGFDALVRRRRRAWRASVQHGTRCTTSSACCLACCERSWPACVRHPGVDHLSRRPQGRLMDGAEARRAGGAPSVHRLA